MPQPLEKVWLYSDAQASMDAAAGIAVEVSRRHSASLTILGVVEASVDPLLKIGLGQELVRLVREDKLQRLRQLEEQARSELPQDRVASTLLDGDVAWHALTSHAVEHHPDLIVVPADGGASAGPFGTLSQHLFRKCPAPVWSIQANASGFPKRVLVAVDSGTEGSDARLLSQVVLRFAADLASPTGMELHVSHAWSLWGESFIASKFGLTDTQSYLDLLRQSARDSTEQLLRETECQEKIVAVHYPKGKPGEAIPALAEEIGADVVILGSAARRGLDGFFIGSVAETILSRLGRSAIVVKRPGFVSPVRAR